MMRDPDFVKRVDVDAITGRDESRLSLPSAIKNLPTDEQSKSSDIRYSIGVGDNITKNQRELARENQKLKEQIEQLKNGFTASKGYRMDDQAMNRLASRSSVSKARLQKSLSF